MGNIKEYDAIIIGAGVIGCSIARELSYYGLKVALIEKSSYVCSGQSKANGGVIHAGHNEKPGTLKAKLCVEGNRMFPKICRELGVKHRKTGYLVTAFNDTETKTLERLKEQSRSNGVRVEIIGSQKLKKIEPEVSSDALAALWVLDTAIIDVHRYVIALAEHAAVNGVDLILEEEVLGLVRKRDQVKGVITGNRKYTCRLVINCAGLNADEIAGMAGLSDFTLVPRKGEYYVLDKEAGKIINGAIYPVPSPRTKGIAVFPSVHGNTIFGGNSTIVPDRGDTSTTRQQYREMSRKCARMVPALRNKKVIAGFTGLRASVKGKDFIIDKPGQVEGLLNVAGIDSPGLSSAPAIAKYVINKINDDFFKIEKDSSKKRDYSIKPMFRDLAVEQKNILLKKDKRFGRVICRCENVTEGDVAGAIHSPVPATTVDAIKFKTWAGAGRCQGAFDLSRLMKIISRETGIDPASIVKNQKGSNIVMGHTRKK